jgi:capsular polysaccharide biosynthesis protein
MELKEYFAIFRKKATIVLAVVLVSVIGCFSFEFLRPVSFATSLTLNVTRLGSQVTDQYKYDDLYRLQADEKFAETVVQWLKSPRIVSDVFSQAGLDPNQATLRQLAGAIKAEKLSSQVINVQFQTKDAESAKRLADAIGSVVGENTRKLNAEQKETTWFFVVSENPVVRKNQIQATTLLAISILGGLLVGFWIVLIAHYLKKEE